MPHADGSLHVLPPGLDAAAACMFSDAFPTAYECAAVPRPHAWLHGTRSIVFCSGAICTCAWALRICGKLGCQGLPCARVGCAESAVGLTGDL